MKTETVFVLLCTNSVGQTVVASLHRDGATAYAKAERFNADKDPEHPENYYVERWGFADDHKPAVVR